MICTDFTLKLENIDEAEELTGVEIYPEFIRLFTLDTDILEFKGDFKLTLSNGADNFKVVFVIDPFPAGYCSINNMTVPFEIIKIDLLNQKISIQFEGLINAKIQNEMP